MHAPVKQAGKPRTAVLATLPSATVWTSHFTWFIMSTTAMTLYCWPPPVFRYIWCVAERGA